MNVRMNVCQDDDYAPNVELEIASDDDRSVHTESAEESESEDDSPSHSDDDDDGEEQEKEGKGSCEGSSSKGKRKAAGNSIGVSYCVVSQSGVCLSVCLCVVFSSFFYLVHSCALRSAVLR